MPTLEPDPEAQRQPSAPGSALPLLLPCLCQFSARWVRLMANTQLHIQALRLFLQLIPRVRYALIRSPSAPIYTKLRFHRGMDF